MQAASTGPSQMSNSVTIALFELQKLFNNKRGILSIVAFSLVWGIILLYPIRGASDYLLSPDFKAFIASFFGEGAVNQLFQWQVAELAVFWCLGLYLFPLFSIFIAADQFASDRSRGTFRFLTLRASRNSIFFGRFIGQMAIQLFLVILAVSATVLLAISRDSSLIGAAIFDGVLVTLNLFIVLLPFTALMAILSLHASTARQATVQAIVFWALTSIAMAAINFYAPQLAMLEWTLPGAQLSSMINTQGMDSLSYSAIPLLQALVLLFIGRLYMIRIAL
ncbi:ABC transporter permease subunit [Shewanella gelidii]|uniref:ABC transporter n=1 Tax=Shewanella gelidii TaxID=1642821 RepID=A0A917NCZ2_9GAMM|nr:ABC transporter permease subunit [Shewanella gelidii]MCL1098972.1 ABC transporter permease [Shewanella gelidii]GGI89213.1 ABC transporter [Shewanella gelidii]